MGGKGLFDFFESEVFPGCRDVLLLRVGPPVGIVEVDHHLHPEFFGAACHLQHILLGAPPATGVHPYAEPDSVHPVIFHQPGVFALVAESVDRVYAAGLIVGCAADVCAEP